MRPGTGPQPSTQQYASWFLHAERHRADHVRVGGKSHWRMLVDLWLAASEGRSNCVKNVCLAGDVPAATGLRYIEQLRDAGLIEEEADPLDRRRRLVRLTARGQRTVQVQLASEAASLARAAGETSD